MKVKEKTYTVELNVSDKKLLTVALQNYINVCHSLKNDNASSDEERIEWANDEKLSVELHNILKQM